MTNDENPMTAVCIMLGSEDSLSVAINAKIIGNLQTSTQSFGAIDEETTRQSSLISPPCFRQRNSKKFQAKTFVPGYVLQESRSLRLYRSRLDDSEGLNKWAGTPSGDVPEEGVKKLPPKCRCFRSEVGRGPIIQQSRP